VHERVEVLLRGGKALKLDTKEECRAYLGRNFRVVLNVTNPEVTDKEVGEIFVQENVCVHLKNYQDRLNFLLLMVEKLYALVAEEI
jgi:DNA-directed RNA polymerase I subunit RPA2